MAQKAQSTQRALVRCLLGAALSNLKFDQKSGQFSFTEKMSTWLQEMNKGQVNYSTERTISNQKLVSADLESVGILTGRS
jgi:hypothetical protein